MRSPKTDNSITHSGAQSAQHSYRRPESILLIVYTPECKTLLLKRTPPGGFWQSVTGSMNWEGESVRQTALRELKEETGIEVNITDIIDWNRSFRFEIPHQVQHRYHEAHRTNKENMLSVCLPDELPVVLRAQEHTDYQWTSIQRAQQIVWSWSNRDALRMVEKSTGCAS